MDGFHSRGIANEFVHYGIIRLLPRGCAVSALWHFPEKVKRALVETRSAMRGGIAWRFDFESRVMVEGITLTMGDLLSMLVNDGSIRRFPEFG
jgi:hypothetical protein